MRVAKYSIAAILLCIGMIFSGEIYQLYCNSFADFYNVSFYLQEDTIPDDMIADINRAASDNEVEVFFLDMDTKTSYSTVITIYGSDIVKTYLIEEYSLKEGKRGSLFSGENEILYKAFEDIPYELLETQPESYYVIGSKENATEFKRGLVEKYAGSFPQINNVNSRREALLMLSAVWFGIIGIIIFVTYYELVRRKKEHFVLMTMGVNIKNKMLKLLLSDTLVYGAVFGVASAVIAIREGGLFCYRVSVTFVLILMAINAVVHFLLSRVNYKRDIAGVSNANKVLAVNYVYKLMATVILLITLSGNIIEICEYVELYSQRNFYRSLDDYYYVWVAKKTDESARDRFKTENDFYYNYVKTNNILQIEWYNIDASEPKFLTDNRVVQVNSNMLWYIKEKLPELSDVDFSDSRYIIVPKEYENDIDDILEWYEMRAGSAGTKVIWYSADAKFSVQSNEDYRMIKNPVIVYTNVDCMDENSYDFSEMEFAGLGINPNIYFVKITPEEFEAIANSYGYTGKSENVANRYEHALMVMRRAFVCNLGVSLLMIAIEFGIIISLVRLEYDINRKELIIKKILGTSLLRRFAKLYILTIATGVICVAGTVAVSVFFDVGNPFIVGICGALTVIFELIFISYMCVKNDRESIQRTLKNGF